MGSKERKKHIERFYLDRFQALAGWDRIFEDSERPDFLARTKDGVLGVEVTQLFKDDGEYGSALKEGEERNSRFLITLARAYYSDGGEPILVTALLPNTPPDDKIPYFVRRLKRHRPRKVMERARFEAYLKPGPKTVMYVTSLPADFVEYKRWQCTTDSTGWVRRISREMLVSKMAEKARSLSQYRKSADRIVLLIVVDRTKNSGMLELEGDATPLPNHGFDEVHLLIDPLKACRIA